MQVDDYTTPTVRGGIWGGPKQLPHVATTNGVVLELYVAATLRMASSSLKDDHPFHEPRRVNYYYGIIDDQDLAAILCILLVVAQTV